MKNILALVVLALLGPCLCANAEMQTWRSPGGYTFEGEFIKLENQNVTLKGADGRQVDVPLQSLDDESRGRVQLAAAPKSAAGKSGVLFRHETPNYRLSLSSSGTPAELVFLEAGKPVNLSPFLLEIHHHEIIGKEYKYIGFREMESPLRQEKDRVTWRGRFANGTVTEIVFDLLPEGVNVRYKLEVPSESMPTLAHRLSLVIPPTLKFDAGTRLFTGVAAPDGIPFERVETALKDYSLLHTPYSGKSGTLNFKDPQKGSLGGRKLVRVKGPFARKEIEFLGPEVGQGLLDIWFYDGKALYEGVRLRFLRAEKADLREQTGVFGIRFK